VQVETFIGPVEGTLKHIDFRLSHNQVDKYPDRLILENENGFIIIRHWQTIKKTILEDFDHLDKDFKPTVTISRDSMISVKWSLIHHNQTPKKWNRI